MAFGTVSWFSCISRGRPRTLAGQCHDRPGDNLLQRAGILPAHRTVVLTRQALVRTLSRRMFRILFRLALLGDRLRLCLLLARIVAADLVACVASDPDARFT